MIDRALKIIQFPLPASIPTSARSVRRRAQRSSARAAFFFGVIAFIALTAGLMAILEDVRPELRDPEFGIRLQQLKEWKQKAPERPLVLAIGSSRMQFGLSPSAMGFSNEPNEPLVYNLGYQGALPNMAALNLIRVLDAGIRPQCVLVEFVPRAYVKLGMIHGNTFADCLRNWPNRFSLGDMRRMAELEESFGDDRALAMRCMLGYATPWSTQRLVLISRFLPDWLPEAKRIPVNVNAQPSDKYGFAPILATTITDEKRLSNLVMARNAFGQLAEELRNFGQIPPLSPMIGALVRRCRTEGIPLAFVWIPESAALREGFPQFQAIGETYAANLIRDYGVALFPAPHQPEEDFMDGYHLLPSGAQRYSRWLADTYLKPWLVAHGLKKQ
jgi:hypothetical protein